VTAWTPEYRIRANGDTITGITLVGFSITSGRTDVNSQAQAGYAAIRILNLTNQIYTWGINTSINIEVKDTTATFVPIFGGRISDIAVGVERSGSEGAVTVIDIYALGALAKLQNAVWEGSLSKALDGIQIRTILESLLTNAWNEVPPAETWATYNATETWENAQNIGIGEIDEGEYEMISRSAAPVNMYSYVADLANSGIGYLYEDANGLISYGDANHRQEYLVANGYVNLDANDALADGIRSTTRQGDLVNSLVVNYKNNFGTSYTFTDQSSIDTFGLYARSINSLIDDDPDAEEVAERFVTFRSTPKSKFDSITFALQNPEISDANRNSLLNVFMGMPVAIANLPANINSGSFVGYVEGWTFRSTLSGLSISLTLSPTEFWTVAQDWDQVTATLEWTDVDATLTWQNATGVIL
jgi:hypothetical protein